MGGKTPIVLIAGVAVAILLIFMPLSESESCYTDPVLATTNCGPNQELHRCGRSRRSQMCGNQDFYECACGKDGPVCFCKQGYCINSKTGQCEQYANVPDKCNQAVTHKQLLTCGKDEVMESCNPPPPNYVGCKCSSPPQCYCERGYCRLQDGTCVPKPAPG